MGTIKAGWKVAIINPEGEIVDTIDMEGYNLNKLLAASSVSSNINEAIEEAGGYDTQ